MIRVLHIMGGADVGGISSVVYNYYSKIDRDVIHFDIALTTNAFGQDGKRLYELGCQFFQLPLKSDSINIYIKELRTLLEKEHYDVIHVHENETSYVALKVAKEEGVKVRIAHSHTSSPSNSLKGDIKRLTGCYLNNKYATNLIACGKLAGDRVFGKRHMKLVKATVLYNAIDCPLFAFCPEARESLRRELNIEDKFVIGIVGRLSPEKNQLRALEIMQAYLRVNPKAVLLVIGNGEDEYLLKEYVVSNNMMPYVIFLGARSDVNKLYSAMDLAILTSVHEGFPVVGVESLVSGLPLILSSSITDELKQYECVEYCELSDTEAWVAAIDRYNSAIRVGSKDSKLLKDFDLENNVCKLENIYQFDNRLAKNE